MSMITFNNNTAAHPGGTSICGSGAVPFHIVQGATDVEVIPLGYNDGVDPLGHQFHPECFGALADEKGLAEIVHCRALRDHCSVVS